MEKLAKTDTRIKKEGVNTMTFERDPHIIAAAANIRAEAFMSGAMWMAEQFGKGEDDSGHPSRWLAANDEARKRFWYSTNSPITERPSVIDALKKLVGFKAYCALPDFKASPYYHEDFTTDLPFPFLSEGFLYIVLGKEEGRTVRALFGQIAAAVGYDSLWDLEREMWNEEKTEQETVREKDGQ